MDLSVVIVTWNSEGHIGACLESVLRETTGLEAEVLVIDNASSDGTARLVRDRFSSAILVVLEENAGFPRANNVGIRRARGRHILALNPDTELGPGSLVGPMRFLDDHPAYGCAGVRTMTSDGRIQLHCARQFPRLKGMLASYLYLDKIFRRARFLGSPDMPYWDHQDSRDIDMIQGAYMLMRGDMLRAIGGFDETLPMFFEDRELCLRIWRAGWKIRYLAEYFMIHHVGQSTRQAPSSWVARLRLESDLAWVRAYEGPRQARLFVLFVLLGFPLRLSLALVVGGVLSVVRRRPIVRDWVSVALVSVPWALGQVRRPVGQGVGAKGGSE